jgi:hypothetical protein
MLKILTSHSTTFCIAPKPDNTYCSYIDMGHAFTEHEYFAAKSVAEWAQYNKQFPFLLYLSTIKPTTDIT